MSYDELRARQLGAGAAFELYRGLERAAHYGDALAEYWSAIEDAALVDDSVAGRIAMYDHDRAALLHRLSTNDIERLQPGAGARSVLTSPIGRIIDLLTVYALDDRLLLVTSPGQGPAVYGLLRKNIFFNDKVRLEGLGQSMGQLALYGPRAAAVIQGCSGAPVDELPLHHLRAATIAGVELHVARALPLGGAGFALYVPAAGLPTVWDALLGAGARPMGQAAFDVLRVEAGYGAFGRELTSDYIPLETGLWDAISFTKGCYVGQEIIARMESRNRLAKMLRGLKLQEQRAENREQRTENREQRAENREQRTENREQSPDSEISVPGSLFAVPSEGKEAGVLTSVARSPRYGLIGLAYMRVAHADPGAVVAVADGELQAEVVDLPFTQV